eukprot:scaffold305989_cov28-Tisochrysis_lutea.AAC.1
MWTLPPLHSIDLSGVGSEPSGGCGMDSTSAIVVTPELQEVMREYTKAVMRDKPDNLLEYSQHWFVTKYTERRMGVDAFRCLSTPSRQLPPLSLPLTPSPPPHTAAYELESSTSDVFASLSGDVQDQIEDLFKRCV